MLILASVLAGLLLIAVLSWLVTLSLNPQHPWGSRLGWLRALVEVLAASSGMDPGPIRVKPRRKSQRRP